LPAALRYSISYELFWKINPRIMKAFQAEYNRSVKERYEEMNYSAWLSGLYIVSSIQKALDPKKAKYPDAPFGEEDKVIDESSDLAATRFNDYVDAFNNQFKK